jgi:hypothetical protein
MSEDQGTPPEPFCLNGNPGPKKGRGYHQRVPKPPLPEKTRKVDGRRRPELVLQPLPEDDRTTPAKRCPSCRQRFPIDCFLPSRKRSNGCYAYCIPCHRRRNRDSYHRVGKKRTTEQVRRVHFKHKYGITEREYFEMLRDQGGVCAICGREETMTKRGKVQLLSVDHSHSTGRVRGLLCCLCNLAIGFTKDDTEILRKMIEYLKRHESE